MALNDQVYLDRRQKILDQIFAHPENHNQTQWEKENPHCGTQRCVAGWAIYFAAKHSSSVHLGRYEVAAELRVEPQYGVIAAALLGLTDAEAFELFYDADNLDAIDLLRQYAQGETEVVHTDNYDPDYHDLAGEGQ